MPLLCALDQQLIVSSAAPLTSLILVNREALLQARLLSVALSAVIIIGLGTGTVGGVGNLSLVSSMPSGVVHDPVDSSYAPPSSSRGNYLPTQSQASYHSASSSPSARRPSSGFDGVNEDANVRANATVVDRHADVRASAMMTDDNNDDVDDGNFDDTLSEILRHFIQGRNFSRS